MGLWNTSITLLLTPVFASLALMKLVLSPVSSSPSFVNKASERKRVAAQRGRLVLFAVDETSLQAINWALRDLLATDDFVHILHIEEIEEKRTETIQSFSFTAADLKKASQVKGLEQCCKALTESGIQFDGRFITRSNKESTEDLIVRAVYDVKPDLVLLGSSKRLGEQDIGNVATSVALKSPVTVTLVK